MKQLLFLLILLLLNVVCYAQHRYVKDAMYGKYGKDNEKKGEDWLRNASSGKVEPEYIFPRMIVMRTTRYRRGKENGTNEISYYTHAEKNYFAMRATEEGSSRRREPMLIIYDYAAGSLIMLNEQEKTGMAMNLNAFRSREAAAGAKDTRQGTANGSNDCQATGKTKEILGYTCELYICTDQERNRRSEIWLTKKAVFDFSKASLQGPLAGYFNGLSGMNGLVMEAEFYKDDELEMKMQVTRADMNAHVVISTKGYTFGMR